MSGAAGAADGETLGTLVRLALAEDVGAGDWTTLWTVSEARLVRAVVVAKQDLIVAGTAAAVAVFDAVDPELAVEVAVADGQRAAAGDVLLRLAGGARPILTAERTALNFLGHLCGVATLTRRFADAVRGTGARIVDTRKTTPGWRTLEKAAVRAGGGTNHRMGLHDMVLVKENHIEAAGGLEAAVERVREANDDGLPVEVEVRTLEELERALELGLDRVLLDNMDVPTLREAVARAGRVGQGRPRLEASGNVTLDTVRAVAETGVDLISVGALTHSAPGADLSLRVEA
ncbi:MAG: carboxylating nicotinate-nucleotide diphosphorylase [Gemmatimonadetes bacterium]|nr:carboxylating nicotinate-nucleotide diphosphorylase [Gemmatimonadota bacterium]